MEEARCAPEAAWREAARAEHYSFAKLAKSSRRLRFPAVAPRRCAFLGCVPLHVVGPASPGDYLGPALDGPRQHRAA